MMYFLGGKWCDAFVEPSCDHCRRVQKLVYFKDFVTVMVEKIVMATNNSGSNSTYLLISREEELSGEELAKRIAEEKCLCCIWRLVY